MSQHDALHQPHPPALPGIPPEADGLFRQLMAEPPVPVIELVIQVSAHMDEIRRQAVGDETVDFALAEELAKRSVKLLERSAPDPSEANRQLIQAAVRYFVENDDAEDDLNSVVGFNDDAQVMNAVATYLGYPDLLVHLE